MTISNSRRRTGASRSNVTARDALRYALRLISIRGRSERELRDRLRRKGFEEGETEGALTSLKKKGLVDDAALAEELIQGAERKALGIRGVYDLLRKRGIPEEIIDSAGVDRIDARRVAGELVRKRIGRYRGLPEEKVRRRLRDQLLRRGHSPETIRRVLDEFVGVEE